MIKCFRFVDAFVLVNQHGRRNVNCKPAVGNLRYGKTIWQNCCKMSCMALLLVSITHTQTRLATNQAVAGCQKFLQKLENSSTFCNKSVHVARFTGPRQTCHTASDVNPVNGSRVILSNQTSVFKQLAATFIQVWTWVVKRASSLSIRSAAMLQNKLHDVVAVLP